MTSYDLHVILSTINAPNACIQNSYTSYIWYKSPVTYMAHACDTHVKRVCKSKKCVAQNQMHYTLTYPYKVSATK